MDRTNALARPAASAEKDSRAGDHAARGRHPAGGDLKMRQILDGARQIFLADGFEGASMNDIARAASVSKGTLYVYFPSKEILFEALVRHDRSLQAEQLFQFPEDDDDLAHVLMRIGVGLMEQMCTADHLAHLRLVIGAVAKYPRIGQAFHAAGPKAGAVMLGAYLQRQASEGDSRCLMPSWPPISLSSFARPIITRRPCSCVAPPADNAAVKRAVEAAVDMFLRAYGEQQPRA